MDWLGVVLLSAAFLSIYLAIDQIQNLAGANWWLVAVELIAGAALFIGFWQVENHKKNPMVAIGFWQVENHKKNPMVATKYLKQRRTWGLLLTTLLTMTGVFAIMNGIVPALAQDTQFGAGISTDPVSLFTLTPYALVGLAFGPVAGVLASKRGSR